MGCITLHLHHQSSMTDLHPESESVRLSEFYFFHCGNFNLTVFDSIHETLAEHWSSLGTRPDKKITYAVLINDLFCYCHIKQICLNKQLFLSKVTEGFEIRNICSVIIGLVLSYKPKTRSKFSPSFLSHVVMLCIFIWYHKKKIPWLLNKPYKVKRRSFLLRVPAVCGEPNLWAMNWTAGLLGSMWWVIRHQQKSYLLWWPALGRAILFF